MPWVLQLGMGQLSFLCHEQPRNRWERVFPEVISKRMSSCHLHTPRHMRMTTWLFWRRECDWFVNRGIVTALRHSFYVQAANSHKWTSQWFWEIISWADNGQPHTPYPTATAPTTAVLVNFYGPGSTPQGGSRLQEPHLLCLLGGLVSNPKHEWTWMSANFII